MEVGIVVQDFASMVCDLQASPYLKKQHFSKSFDNSHNVHVHILYNKFSLV